MYINYMVLCFIPGKELIFIYLQEINASNNYYFSINNYPERFTGYHNMFIVDKLNNLEEDDKYGIYTPLINLTYEVTKKNDSVYLATNTSIKGMLYLPNLEETNIASLSYITDIIKLLNNSDNILIFMNNNPKNKEDDIFIEITYLYALNLLSQYKKIRSA